MARRVLAFLEIVSPDQDRRPRERALLLALAWMRERLGMEVELVLWGESRLTEVPAPLAGCRLHRLEEMPPTSLMSTVDLAACATGFIRAFSPDVVAVTTSLVNSNLHLLAAAFSFLQPSGFVFGVTELATDEDGRLFCRRPAAGALLEMTPAFPVVLGITHGAGLPTYGQVPAPEPVALPFSELGLELELIQMRSALYPEPVSIIPGVQDRLTDLETAVAWWTADEEAD